MCHKDQFLLFNISLNHLSFSLDCNVSNFEDGLTPFACNKSLDFVLSELECNSHIATNYFQNNYIEMNYDKYNLLVAVRNFQQARDKIASDLL